MEAWHPIGRNFTQDIAFAMLTTIINHNDHPSSTISITINSFLRMVSEPNKHQITINRDSSCPIGLLSLWPSFRFTSLLLRSWGKGAWNTGGGPLERRWRSLGTPVMGTRTESAELSRRALLLGPKRFLSSLIRWYSN